MFKSPLTTLIHWAYQTHHVARDRQIPVDEVRDQQSNLALSRRQFLASSAAIAGASVLGNLTWKVAAADARSTVSPILIVGAGIAGLTAAYRLRQAGIPVDVVEARGRVGGRMHSMPNVAGTSISAELGAEFIDHDHRRMRSLVDELELDLINLHMGQVGLVDTYFFNQQTVSPEQLLQDFAPIARQIDTDFAKLTRFQDYKTATPEVRRLDQQSIADYLDMLPTTETLRIIIDVAYTAEYGIDINEQSCLNLLNMIDATSDRLSLYGASEEGFCVKGGNDQIPKTLAKRVESSIQPHTSLERIRSLSDGRYQVTLRSDQGVSDRTYERVILALPFSVLRTIDLDVDLSPVKRAAIAQLGYGSNNKLITGYREKVWRDRYQATALTFSDLPFQSVWEASHSQYGSKDNALLTNFVGGRSGVELGNQSTEEAIAQLLPQLNQVYPGVQDAYLQQGGLRTSWVHDPFSRGSYSGYRVGQWTQFYGVEGERVGNLFFVGEHCSKQYQGWMEGACETAEQAVATILAEVGRSI